MDNNSVFIVTIIARTLLALACVILAFVSINYGWNLITNGKDKKGKTEFKGKWGENEVNISASSAGALIIALSVLWGIPIIFVAPKVKIDGNEVALNIQKHGIEEFVVAIKKQDPQTALQDISKLQDSFAAAFAKKDSDWTVKTLAKSQIDDLGGQPVLSVKMESTRETADIKYFPVQTDHSLEFKPVEIAVMPKQVPALMSQFSCAESIKAFREKAKLMSGAVDLKTHKKALLRYCKKEIEALSKKDREIFMEIDAQEEK